MRRSAECRVELLAPQQASGKYYCADMPQAVDVEQRVGVEQDQISALAGFDGTTAVR